PHAHLLARLRGVHRLVQTQTYHEEQVELAGTSVQLLKGGSGLPILVLPGLEGPEGWLDFHEALAQHATVYAPTHPGFNGTARPSWMETVPHMAAFYGSVPPDARPAA